MFLQADAQYTGPYLRTAMQYLVVNRKKPILYVYPIHKKSGEEGRIAERRIFYRILGKGTCSQKTGQIGEGGPVQARNHGVTGDQALPEVVSIVDQEVTLPEASEGNRAGFQDRSSFSGSSHIMPPRGGRGILG